MQLARRAIKIGLELSEDGPAAQMYAREALSVRRFPERMDTRYFSNALDIIRDVVSPSHTSFQINRHQCTRLVSLYTKVGEFFDRIIDTSNHFPFSLATTLSLDATVSVLQKGQVLLTKYTEQDWHKSVMMEGLNQGYFEAIHLELEACVRSILEFLQENVRGITRFPFMKVTYMGTLAPLSFLEEHDRVTILGGDAERDRIDMLEKLESRKTETRKKRNLSKKERSSQIHSLDMASESIKHQILANSIPEELPSSLRINPSEITLLEELASGGNAKVRKCRWLGDYYAVKILRTGDVDGLRAEVGKLKALRHPNIVLLAGFSVGEFPMIVMELLDGDLRLLLHRHPLRLRRAVDVMHKIATGMAYLHRQGIFHGDLKSMNVLLRDVDGRSEVKISDFGVSQQIGNSDGEGADEGGTHKSLVHSLSFNGKVGTPMWMAPEVLTSSGNGNKFFSAKADVYSFAMVCVEILTGKKPYPDDPTTLGKVRDYVVGEGKRPKLPWALPDDLRNLIVRCWDEKPERRPDFLEICNSLQKLKAHAPLLQKLRWRLHVVLHSIKFRVAMALVLGLIIFWIFGNRTNVGSV